MPQLDGAVRRPTRVRRAAVDLVRPLEDLLDPAHRVERQRQVAQVQRELLRGSEEEADRPDDEDEVAGGRVAGDDVAPQPPQHQSRERGEQQRRQRRRDGERDALGALALGERVEVVDEAVDEAVGRAGQAHRAQLDEGVDGPAGEAFHGHPHVVLGVDRPRRVACQINHDNGSDVATATPTVSEWEKIEDERERRHPGVRAERHEVRAETLGDVGRGHGAEHEAGRAPGVVHALGQRGEVAEHLLADVAGDAALHPTLAGHPGEEDHRLDDTDADQHECERSELRRVTRREHAIEDAPEHQR